MRPVHHRPESAQEEAGIGIDRHAIAEISRSRGKRLEVSVTRCRVKVQSAGSRSQAACAPLVLTR